MKRGTESTTQALSKSAMRGTAILIAVSLTFIILTGPVSIYYSVVTATDVPILWATLKIPKILNHGINSVMYCIVGSKFRREFIDLICCDRKKVSRSKCKTDMGRTQMTALSIVSTVSA